MSASSNLELLKGYHGALQASEAEQMARRLSPDLRYWILPGSAFSGTHDKASTLVLLPCRRP
jgi:hypothetical protein